MNYYQFKIEKSLIYKEMAWYTPIP